MAIWQADEKTALLIVDPQIGFMPGGNLAVHEGDQIVPLINALRPYFGVVVISQDWHPEGHVSFASSHEGKNPFVDTIELDYGIQALWPDHCVQGTPDAEFHPTLNVGPSDIVIQKGTNPNIDSYSAFYENDQKTHPVLMDGQTLTEKLQELGITKLVIVGLAFDYCVGWTALDAVKEGFEAIIIADATKGIAVPTQNGTSDTVKDMKQQLAKAGVRVVQSKDLFGLMATSNNRTPVPAPKQ